MWRGAPLPVEGGHTLWSHSLWRGAPLPLEGGNCSLWRGGSHPVESLPVEGAPLPVESLPVEGAPLPVEGGGHSLLPSPVSLFHCREMFRQITFQLSLTYALIHKHEKSSPCLIWQIFSNSSLLFLFCMVN